MKAESTFVFASEAESSPWPYRDVLETIRPNERIVGFEIEAQIRAIFTKVLVDIEVGNVERHSFHSFQRGEAHLASLLGVNDSAIKVHGRWKSEAYLRYVVVDRQQAGMEVSTALSRGDSP